MTFDEFVQQPQIYDDRIQHQLAKAERLKELCNRATSVYNGEIKVQESRTNSREKWLTEYADSKGQLYDLMEMRDAAADQVRTWLHENLPYEQATILEYKYCDNMNYEAVAKCMGYAYQTIRTKGSKAAAKAKDIYYQQQTERG